jgi:phosphoglycolate phosphatase
MSRRERLNPGLQAILFDLDGTLTDPRQGITTCIQYALTCLGRNPPAADELTWCIGPPLLQSLEQLLADSPEHARKALAHYRERYADHGIFEAHLYPGVSEMLGGLCAAGFQLFLATSKPHVFAHRVLDHFEISRFFAETYGSELDGTRSDKGELIAHVLQQQGLRADRVVMIGDRKHDMWGARQNGVLPLGAGWGYGSQQELEQAGAARVLREPKEVLSCCLDLRPSMEADSGDPRGPVDPEAGTCPTTPEHPNT